MDPEGQSAASLRDQFLEHQQKVISYIGLLERKVAILGSEASALCRTLKTHGCLEDEPDQSLSAYSRTLELDEIEKLCESIVPAKPQVQSVLDSTLEQFDQAPQPRGLSSTDMRSEVGEWTQYFLEMEEDEVSAKLQTDGFWEERQQIEQVNLESAGDPDFEPVDPDEILPRACEYARYLLMGKKAQELSEALRTIDDIEIIRELSRPQTILNARRQGFIVLMTIFDATLFDLVKLALKSDFFKLIAHFGEGEKISLQELGEYGSFESLQTEVIEDQLKRKYLKDILFFLKRQGVSCVDGAAGHTFAHLIEMVLRRNVHVHNRGIVDEQYLQADESGTPQFNIYNLDVGMAAPIDPGYWRKANQLCSACVDRVADWVDTLPLG